MKEYIRLVRKWKVSARGWAQVMEEEMEVVKEVSRSVRQWKAGAREWAQVMEERNGGMEV